MVGLRLAESTKLRVAIWVASAVKLLLDSGLKSFKRFELHLALIQRPKPKNQTPSRFDVMD